MQLRRSSLLFHAVAILHHFASAGCLDETWQTEVNIDSGATLGLLQIETTMGGNSRGQAETRAPTDSFCIVVMPDTQHYPEKYPALYTNVTQWIADEIEVRGNPLNIVFVSHMGDVVEDGNNGSMWASARKSMSVLQRSDGSYIVPYGVMPGNHDYRNHKSSSSFPFGSPDAIRQVKQSGTANYLSYFGPSRFTDAAWYGGTDSLGTSSFQYFTAGRIKFLHLSLEWAPQINSPHRDVSPLEWAEGVLHKNSGLPVILSTHEYLSDIDGSRSSVGNTIFNRLVRRHDKIFMVLCGHFHSGRVRDGKSGVWHQTSMNDFGRPVIEVMQNFQDSMPTGGNGWLRIFKFNPSAGTLHVRTYSPWLDAWKTETVEERGGWAQDFTLDLGISRILA